MRKTIWAAAGVFAALALPAWAAMPTSAADIAARTASVARARQYGASLPFEFGPARPVSVPCASGSPSRPNALSSV